jgi:hypothetical protein
MPKLSTFNCRTTQIRKAHVITQPQKLHSQFVGLVTAVMNKVAGLSCSSVYSMGPQPDGVIYNNLTAYTHQLLFSYVRTSPQ